MKIPALFVYFLLFILILQSCKTKPGETKTVDIDSAQTTAGAPDWILQGNIYEVNIRQYTKEGTFKAFEQQLDRLRDMGVQTLWFMPLRQ